MAKGQIKISGISIPKRGRKIKDIVPTGGGCGCGVGAALPPMTGGYVSIDALQRGGQIPSWLSSAITQATQIGQEGSAVEPPSVAEGFAKESPALLQGGEPVEPVDAEVLPAMDVAEAPILAPLEDLEPALSGGDLEGTAEFEEMVPDAVIASQPNKIGSKEQSGGKRKQKRIPREIRTLIEDFEKKGGVTPAEKKKLSAVSLKAQRGGYKPTKKDLEYLRKWKRGESIGFTMTASLKAKGLIPRESKTMKGKRVVSNKYKK